MYTQLYWQQLITFLVHLKFLIFTLFIRPIRLFSQKPPIFSLIKIKIFRTDFVTYY